MNEKARFVDGCKKEWRSRRKQVREFVDGMTAADDAEALAFIKENLRAITTIREELARDLLTRFRFDVGELWFLEQTKESMSQPAREFYVSFVSFFIQINLEHIFLDHCPAAEAAGGSPLHVLDLIKQDICQWCDECLPVMRFYLQRALGSDFASYDGAGYAASRIKIHPRLRWALLRDGNPGDFAYERFLDELQTEITLRLANLRFLEDPQAFISGNQEPDEQRKLSSIERALERLLGDEHSAEETAYTKAVDEAATEDGNAQQQKAFPDPLDAVLEEDELQVSKRRIAGFLKRLSPRELEMVEFISQILETEDRSPGDQEIADHMRVKVGDIRNMRGRMKAKRNGPTPKRKKTGSDI